MMMHRNKKKLLALGILFLFQLIIFWQKNRFEYYPAQTIRRLYSPPGNTGTPWNRMFKDWPDSELTAARRITDSLLPANPDTDKKIIRLGSFLYNRFRNQFGQPDAAMNALSPWQQYRIFSADTTKHLWCGHIANIFTWFCGAAGITCRTVEIMQSGDHHVVNEVYLPELKKWVLTDLTHNQLLVMNEENDFADLISFRDQLAAGHLFTAFRSRPDSTNPLVVHQKTNYIIQYYNPSLPVYYYHTNNLQSVYRTREKITRYFWPVSWYAVYDPKAHSNAGFYTKQILTALSILLILSFLYPRKRHLNKAARI